MVHVHTHGGVAMAKAKAKKVAVPVRRVTVVNIKGTEAEREYLHSLCEVTGIPVAEIIRRSVAGWARRRKLAAFEHWRGD